MTTTGDFPDPASDAAPASDQNEPPLERNPS
jgi:hypothetical protein